LAKNSTLVASRTTLQGMRASLSGPAATWLETHSAHLENVFTRRFTADNAEVAGEAETQFDALLETQVILENGFRFTAGDYLRNALIEHPRVVISQNRALNIRTEFAAMDRGLAVVELRAHGSLHAPMDKVRTTYGALMR